MQIIASSAIIIPSNCKLNTLSVINTVKLKQYLVNFNLKMNLFSILVLIVFIKTACSSFPSDFMFGVATASYQIEGAWNENGKGENIWDRLIHTQPDLVIDHSNADIADDAYHQTETDIKLLKDLGVHFYRFSISWSRILPNGYANFINEEGVKYYSDLIDALLANDIIPFVTIYHWDLPQNLQEVGGWPSPVLVDYFEDFCDVLFKLFGDRVKYWTTFNDPQAICEGYTNGRWAPRYFQRGIGDYLCMHTVLKAHARAYRLYEQKYKSHQKGLVGITVGLSWFQPYDDSSSSQEATKRALTFEIQWILDPIYSISGDYPELLKTIVAKNSAEENFPRSRLPSFSQSEIDMIRGSSDFLGVNHYTSYLVLDGANYSRPSFQYDELCDKKSNDSWPAFESRPQMKEFPEGFYKILMWIKDNYNNPLTFITENGYADFGELEDVKRIKYMQSYLEELAHAIEDGCNVKGYAHWSFLDNFEWLFGYTQRYGLYHVDYNNPKRPRQPKLSAAFYRDVIKSYAIESLKNSINQC